MDVPEFPNWRTISDHEIADLEWDREHACIHSHKKWSDSANSFVFCRIFCCTVRRRSETKTKGNNVGHDGKQNPLPSCLNCHSNLTPDIKSQLGWFKTKCISKHASIKALLAIGGTAQKAYPRIVINSFRGDKCSSHESSKNGASFPHKATNPETQKLFCWADESGFDYRNWSTMRDK